MRASHFVFFNFALIGAVASLGSPARCNAADKPPSAGQSPSAAAVPKVGDKAADHALEDVDGKTVRFSEQLKAGPLVVVVLRGWPGYQCPFCTKQVADLLAHARDFESAGAGVMLVYPGPADGLRTHAAEFRKDREFPPQFRLLVDPDYHFAVSHGLRWDAPNETVYPATFVLDRQGVVRFVRVSHEHGGRVAAKEIIEVLSSLEGRRDDRGKGGER
jgi:peroxiredoxin